MKNTLLFFGLLISISVSAQRYKSSESFVRFFSEAPLEDIEAVNENATSIVDVASKSIVIIVPIKSFEFEKKLMQEHFNENYLESDDYPNAVFKGKITDWEGEEGTSKAVAKGTLEMHGKTQEVEISGDLEYQNNVLKLSTVFPIKLEDYKIKIPKAVFYNIAEEVEVTATFEYKPYEKN